jgi:hypothetical protein
VILVLVDEDSMIRISQYLAVAVISQVTTSAAIYLKNNKFRAYSNWRFGKLPLWQTVIGACQEMRHQMMMQSELTS